MTTVLYSHPDCLEHDTGHDHPESADRLRAVLQRVDGLHFPGLQRRRAPEAARSHLTRVHDPDYVSRVFDAIPARGEAWIAPDVVVTPGSALACLRAVGAACAAVDEVKSGAARNVFCAVRPPGHHAGPHGSMGFCVFNNVAVAAAYARARHGFRRVAIVDFDVHHGNGTQSIFRHDPDVCFISVHQSMIFPMSGSSSDVGVGNILNVPLARNTSAAAFRQAVERTVLPRLRDFRPDLMFISAGFDAHIRDPLGDLKLMTADFHWLTAELMRVADAYCGGRLVSVLEGGYNPDALADACEAHLKALTGG